MEQASQHQRSRVLQHILAHRNKGLECALVLGGRLTFKATRARSTPIQQAVCRWHLAVSEDVSHPIKFIHLCHMAFLGQT